MTGSGSAGANCHRVRPNLNGFVERFQSTVLHQHYRTAFRYRFYDDIDVLDADLQAWLRHYNFERRTAATGWPAAAQPTSPTPPAQTLPITKGWTEAPHPALTTVRTWTEARRPTRRAGEGPRGLAPACLQVGVSRRARSPVWDQWGVCRPGHPTLDPPWDRAIVAVSCPSRSWQSPSTSTAP